MFEADEKYRVALILALLKNGASANGLKNKKEFPLQLALKPRDYKLVVTLLQHGADAACLLGKPGDSLLHEALKQMLTTGLSICCHLTDSTDLPHFLKWTHETTRTTTTAKTIHLTTEYYSLK